MNKKILGIFSCTLLIATGVSFSGLAEQNNKIILSERQIISIEAISYEVNLDTDGDTVPSSYIVDTLDQQQSIDSGIAWYISENGYFAQSFKPTFGKLTRVELKCYKKGNPNEIRISIRSDLTSPDLTSKYLPGISISTTPTWTEFDFPDISVKAGNTYYIVWDPVGVPNSNTNFFWSTGINNAYKNGSAWHNLGSSWEIFNPVESPNPDFCFKTYGISHGANTPPIVVIECPEEEERQFYDSWSEITVYGYAEDDYGVVWYEILTEYPDGTSHLQHYDLFQEYPHESFYTEITLKEGLNKITVTAYDIDSQHGEDSLIARYNSGLDTIPPILNIDYSIISFQSNIEVTFTAEDNCGVYIDTIELRRPDNIFYTDSIGPFGCLSQTDTVKESSNNGWWELGKGVNTIYAHASDENGNEVEEIVQVLYIKSQL